MLVVCFFDVMEILPRYDRLVLADVDVGLGTTRTTSELRRVLVSARAVMLL